MNDEGGIRRIEGSESDGSDQLQDAVSFTFKPYDLGLLDEADSEKGEREGNRAMTVVGDNKGEGGEGVYTRVYRKSLKSLLMDQS